MCNLYRMTKNASEVAAWFDAVNEAAGGNWGAEVYPGTPGLVMAEGKVKACTWGFPLQRKGAKGQPLKPKPVNNTRTDKLGSPFWKSSFEKRRCLIPVEAFAEAEGEKGAKTRTWFSAPDADLLAIAGIWRWSEEWGAVYSMIMTEAAPEVEGVHDRSPVIIGADQRGAWLDGEPDEAFALCKPWQGGLEVERTDAPWVRR
ncbi:SOS response-associated peptidase family protein [Alteriqipengyuania sp. WL0013]|uniref:SOS response-associated peptidase n=1 Tax=Alteriqipengyuania sp. WL0013 TaxID=3110773 RepID=UPI002C4A77B8|nr:SOS response-associated peptidase family protein [Alteriqipengyuania sp. WL0013]MEB3415501.1 SOS response-associated peptidase family protein [Alteriqipengyuania sp. WL0013]